MPHPPRVALFANTDWYLYNFRLPLAKRLQVEAGAEVWVICPDGPYRPKLEAEGFRWIPVKMDRQSLNPLGDLRTALRLARELARVRPHLLHNFTLKSILAGTLAGKFAGVPRIVNAVTGLGSMFTAGKQRQYRFPRSLLKGFFRLSFRARNIRTIFQNQSDLAELAPEAKQQVRCRLIAGSGFDSVKFHPPGQPPDHPTLLMVTRLLKDKGVGEFCEAARLVSASHPDAEFQVAGEIDDGNPDSYTAPEVEALRQRFPMVQFLGHRDDMPELYRHASIGVLPSCYREGVPRSLIEAAGSGLPLVAVDGDGIRAILQDGVNGRLVPPRDSGALAQAFLDLLADPAAMARFGLESRRAAVEGFDQTRVIDATFSVYNELGFQPTPEAQGRMCVEP